jgi:hypothetical protein
MQKTYKILRLEMFFDNEEAGSRCNDQAPRTWSTTRARSAPSNGERSITGTLATDVVIADHLTLDCRQSTGDDQVPG